MLFLADPRGELPVLGEVRADPLEPLVLAVHVDDEASELRLLRVVDDQDRKLRRGPDGSEVVRLLAGDQHALRAGGLGIPRRVGASTPTMTEIPSPSKMA